MTLTWQMFAIVCPLAMLAGFVDSVAGGGGLISLPAYYLAGLPPVLAAGTNKLSACLGTLAASFSFMKGGRVLWRCALPAAVAALPGSWLGTRVLQAIPEDVIRWMMILAIPLVALVVLRKKGTLQGKNRLKSQWVAPVSFAVGFAIGFYDGLVGPGTGTFLILCFTMLMGMDPVLASGSAKIVNLASNFAALTSLAFSGKVLFALGLPAAVFAIAGNVLGARMTMKKGVGFIRKMLLCVLALLLAKMLSDVLI